MLDDIIHIFYPRTYTLSNGKVVREKFNWGPYITILLIFFTYLCARITNTNLSTFINRFSEFTALLKQMFPPRLRICLFSGHLQVFIPKKINYRL